MLRKSIINLEELNPRLFSFVEELALIKVCIHFKKVLVACPAIFFFLNITLATKNGHHNYERIYANVQGCASCSITSPPRRSSTLCRKRGLLQLTGRPFIIFTTIPFNFYNFNYYMAYFSYNLLLQDLIDIDNKNLITYLQPIHNQFLFHITQDCEVSTSCIETTRNKIINLYLELDRLRKDLNKIFYMV